MGCESCLYGYVKEDKGYGEAAYESCRTAVCMKNDELQIKNLDDSDCVCADFKSRFVRSQIKQAC